MVSSGLTTRVGQQSVDWVTSESGQIRVLRLVDYDGDIETDRLGTVGALRCGRDCVTFPDGPSLAQMRDLMPEFHALWCAVSQQVFELGLFEFTAYVIRVLHVLADGECWTERLVQEHGMTRMGATRSLNWLCRQGHIVATGETVDTGATTRMWSIGQPQQAGKPSRSFLFAVRG